MFISDSQGMETSPLTINCHDQGRDMLPAAKVVTATAAPATEGAEMDSKLYTSGQTMYVTLNSAAQHSPDTVWTLPSEQPELEVAPLGTGKEDGVSDVMGEPPMPFETVEESQQKEDRSKEKETQIGAGQLHTYRNFTHFSPWKSKSKWN